jgi:DivIVA domain-containing protein
LINNWSREKLEKGRGYDPIEVEEFLGRIVRQFSDWSGSTPAASGSTAAGLTDPWRAGVALPRRTLRVRGRCVRFPSFDDLTGTRLSYRRGLLSREGEVLVKVRPRADWRQTKQFIARNKTYSLRSVSITRQVTDDASGLPILTTAHRQTLLADMHIAFPDHGWLRFHRYGPIWGAVDDSGTRHFFLKYVYSLPCSVIVNPADQLSDELLLAIALTMKQPRDPPMPGGGGGG